MTLNPYAAFDCLTIAKRMQQAASTFTAPEIHLFAYLGCLLWLYRENAAIDWGYSFVATELGAPFSLDIDRALNQLTDNACFIRDEHRLGITRSAVQGLGEFAALKLNRDREECLEAACATTSAFSLGMVGNALGSEPELSRAQQLRTSRRLLEEAGQVQLYEQFQVLREYLSHESKDLRLPAVVWLTALYRSREQLDAQA